MALCRVAAKSARCAELEAAMEDAATRLAALENTAMDTTGQCEVSDMILSHEAVVARKP
jgi:hypothetical protein